MMQRLVKMREDSGAMLVIALIVITTVALVTGAVMTHGWTNFRATVGLRGVASTTYAADAAAKVAIDNLRLGADAPGWDEPSFPGLWDDWVYTNNADGMGCFGASGLNPDSTLELDNAFYPETGSQTGSTSARVKCTPVPGTGIFGGGGGVVIEDPTDAFARALTTIGTTGLNGMTLKPLGLANEAPMPMRGGVASKTYIDVDNGALVTDGHAWANGSCVTARIISTDTVCNSPGKVATPSTPDSPFGATGPAPAYKDADSMGCSFVEGFYNNAADLSAAVNGCDVARFAPGKYYFDFRDESHGDGAQNVWQINTKVIGGIGSGNDNIPGACKSPILNDPIQGVQFVFAGTSRIALGASAQVELCGPSNGGEPPMTLYQQQTGASEASVSVNNVSAGTAIPQTGGKYNTATVTPLGATIRDAIANEDLSNVAYKIESNARNEIGVDLRDFAGLTTIPAGADITSATLRVKYTKVSSKNLTVTVKDQTPGNVAVSLPDGTGWGRAEIAAQLRNLLEDGQFDANKPTLQLRLTGASKDDTLVIDAVKLSVTYVPASLRPASDVTFVGATSNFGGKFVVQGATYIPNGYADMNPGNSSTGLVAFRWGIIALGVNFKAQPQQLFGYPLVSIPDPGTGLGSRTTVVDLEVFVCVEQGSCASGGTRALIARVAITDPPYGPSGAPVPGKRKIEVLSWAEQN